MQKYGLHQWTGITTELPVVKGTIDCTFHFLHVSLPVNFCIYVKKYQHQQNFNNKNDNL